MWDGWARKPISTTVNEQRNALTQSVGNSAIKCKCPVWDQLQQRQFLPQLLLVYCFASYELG